MRLFSLALRVSTALGEYTPRLREEFHEVECRAVSHKLGYALWLWECRYLRGQWECRRSRASRGKGRDYAKGQGVKASRAYAHGKQYGHRLARLGRWGVLPSKAALIVKRQL